MATSLCCDWSTVESAMAMDQSLDVDWELLFQPTVLPGFFGASPPPPDAGDISFLQQLCDAGGGVNPDGSLPDLSLDPHYLASLLSSAVPDPSAAAMFQPQLFPAATESDLDLDLNSSYSSLPFFPDPSASVEPRQLPQFGFLTSPVGTREALTLMQGSGAPQVVAVGAGGYGPMTGAVAGKGNPSAQSVAARQRRKRISEKTQELGQLVPGGTRMNTAEMLQAAFKHVKFLQAQIGILDLLRCSETASEAKEPERLMRALLASSAVQEKLAGEEKCLVPECMVRGLTENKETKSRPSIGEEDDRSRPIRIVRP